MRIQIRKTLYFTAEESALQIKRSSTTTYQRIARSYLYICNHRYGIHYFHDKKESPDVIILDSIQMVMSQKLTSMPGALNQVRLCASMFINAVKSVNAIGIVVGHITKDGQLAGPKMLEHMVDVILFFEGERSMSIRMLRALKIVLAQPMKPDYFE